MKWVLVVVVMASCSREPTKPAPAPQPAPPEAAIPSCMADGLGELRNELDFDHACLDEPTCRHACEADDARACVAHAYALQNVKKYDEADRAFARGCKLGIAIACTNYAAAIWAGTQPGSDDCARRVFEAACVKEPVACGMVGRMMAEQATTPEQKARARAYLETRCNEHGGAACRMFAFHLQKGDLGPAESPAVMRALMLRACDTGDPEACGHEDPAATFHD